MSCQRKQTIGAERGSLSKWQAINRAIASGLQPSRTRLDKSAFSLKKFSRSHANDWIMSKRHAKRTELAELNDPSMSLLNNCSSLTMTSILEMWYFLSIAPVLSITVRLNANFHCSRAPQFDGENHDLDKPTGYKTGNLLLDEFHTSELLRMAPPRSPAVAPSQGGPRVTGASHQQPKKLPRDMMSGPPPSGVARNVEKVANPRTTQRLLNSEYRIAFGRLEPNSRQYQAQEAHRYASFPSS